MSEKCPESSGSGRFHVSVGGGDGLWSWTIVRRTEFRALGGSRVYKRAIWGKQIGNPGEKVEILIDGAAEERPVTGFSIPDAPAQAACSF
mgnify:CR=1 FL=1